MLGRDRWKARLRVPALLTPGVKPIGDVEPVHPGSMICYAPNPKQWDIDLFGKFTPVIDYRNTPPEIFDSWLGTQVGMFPNNWINRVDYLPPADGEGGDDFTVFLFGTANNVLSSNGYGITRGYNSTWSMFLGAGSLGNNKAGFAYVDESPTAQVSAILSAIINPGTYIQIAGRKKGNTAAAFNKDDGEKVETTSTHSGVARYSGSTGWHINRGPVEKGHGHYQLVVVINEALSDEEIWAVLDDPIPNLVRPTGTAVPPSAAGATIVYNAAASSFTALSVASQAITLPIESSQNIDNLLAGAFEVNQGVVASESAVFESASLLSVDNITPINSLAMLATARGGALESLLNTASAAQPALESLATSASALSVSYESYSSAIVVSNSATVSIESLQTLGKLSNTAYAVLSGFSRGVDGALESVATLVVAGEAAAEVLASTSNGKQVSMELLLLLQQASSATIEAAGIDFLPTYLDLVMALSDTADITAGLTDSLNITTELNDETNLN